MLGIKVGIRVDGVIVGSVVGLDVATVTLRTR